MNLEARRTAALELIRAVDAKRVLDLTGRTTDKDIERVRVASRKFDRENSSATS